MKPRRRWARQFISPFKSMETVKVDGHGAKLLAMTIGEDVIARPFMGRGNPPK
ncbi:MAG: hypothetical protein K2X02_07590 [Alphaproteobacteria bacterium]|nr:hypothetical protein [Alphaproteobacteria bacterium]